MVNPVIRTQFAVSVNGHTSKGTLKRHLAPLTVGALLRAFPFKGNANRLGKNIIYVKSSILVGIERARTIFTIGDVAFLPSNGSMCFFTTDIVTDRPMSPIGNITENMSIISDVKPGDIMSIYSVNL
ncbi:MAG: Cyclophilin-like domain containing protein [Cenarchaeum symbiont of Oopsacas minuta]|nr:Cyclophilin-like domain containing protein [Cenarchaeum symbiont of Oopsacas minuta]